MKYETCKWKLRSLNKPNVNKLELDNWFSVNFEWMLLFDVHWLLDVNVIDYIRYNKVMELNKWKEILSS